MTAPRPWTPEQWRLAMLAAIAAETLLARIRDRKAARAALARARGEQKETT